MNEKPIPTRPMPSGDKLLKEKFAESIASQSDLMDKLGQQLITLELAIPGLYATVLKLVSGDKATLTSSPVLYLSFACWLLALLLTLCSLIPRRWTVFPNVKKQLPYADTDTLGIEDFFYKSAQYKRRLLIPAAIFFFAGIFCAALSVF